MQSRSSQTTLRGFLPLRRPGFACAAVVLCVAATSPSFLGAERPTPLTASEFKRFFEQRVPAKLREHAVAGATVAVVQNGRVAYSGGFGCAKIAQDLCTPVDPERTLFRAASISKLFTFTALMQLIEQGRVDLDADVNRYIERRDPATDAVLFRVPDAPGQRSILVRDLFRHTPGFEDRSINLFVDDPARAQTLREAVETLPPERVRAPGEQIAYSNYGAILAGYIVQRVSGRPFESYIEEQIFAPLGMNRSTFRQPLPAELASDLSGGYMYTGETPAERQESDNPKIKTNDAEPIDRTKFTPQVFEIIQGAPAGGLTTTAEDMGRFLAAHLDAGRPGNILKPATVRRMHSSLFRPHPNGNGFAHGLMELDSHGQRILGHGGDTIFFHSLAAMLPETNLGFFIATNSASGMEPVWELREEFLNAFYPAPRGETLAKQFAQTDEHAAVDLDAYPGYYATNRRSEREVTKIMSLFMTIDVHLNEQGDGLLIRDFFSGELVDFVPVEPGVFQEREGHKRFLFLANGAGEIESLLSNELAVMTFNRIVWYEWPPLHFGILALGAILILGGFIFRPTGLMMAFSRRYRAGLDADARRAGWLGFGIVVSYVGFLAVFALLTNGIEFIFSIPPRWPFYIPFAAFLFQLAGLLYLLPAWSRRYWGRSGRIFYTAIVLGLFPFFWFLYYWNLVA
jgi:CubicO group peptidase (beta-lactamase class C family)